MAALCRPSVPRIANGTLRTRSFRLWQSNGLVKPTACFSSSAVPHEKVAVLYQAIESPIINGVRKPMKPGGYRDSGADIAYNLQASRSIQAVTPVSNPSPRVDSDWCFPDTEDGILSAVNQGATHLWANTILFASHPLQVSSKLALHQDSLHVIGHGPLVVEKYDDKELVNNLLRRTGGFTMPRSWTISSSATLADDLKREDLPFPIVAKPVRGRGSHGVKVCRDLADLMSHAEALFQESSTIMLEEYLAGEEATVTVMPPSSSNNDYWSLPIVTRFNHQDGIAPYNGVVAVTANSRVVTREETKDPAYGRIAEECEGVARLLGITAPIRIDVRRFENAIASRFALFDVNIKPNMTGPGRPGRDDQASLTLLAAQALGWDYQQLLRRILSTSCSLRTLRELKPKVG